MLAATAMALPGAALAQRLPEPPTRQDLSVGRDAAPAADRSTLTVEGDVERGPCPLADPAFADTRVTFSAVEFTGLPGVPASALDSAWRAFAGSEQPIVNLCEVRDRAASILRGMGFLAAVQVPPQRIEANGTVRMDVLAARLVEVQLRGDAGNSGRLIEAHLAQLTASEWFNARDAERHLLLLEDLPGYDVRLVLRSADRAPGEVVGDVVVARRPVEAVAGAQNLGSRQTGREGGYAALTANDLIGLGDRTTVHLYSTFDWEEQLIVSLAHDLALNADGLRLGGSVLFGWSEPDLGGAPFSSDTFTAEGHLSYAALRRQDHSLFASGGLEVIDQELSFGNTLLSDDQLRVLFLRVDHELVDRASIRGLGGFSVRQPRWRSGLSLELRQGLSGLGASDDCNPFADCLPPNVPISNFAADPSSFVARLEGTLEARPLPLLTAAFRPLAQISDGPLLSYEQVSLGNYTVGRGFEPGVALGDSAIGAALELRYGSLFPRSADAFAFEPFVFLDVARGWIDNAAGLPDPRRVLSTGAGLRARWGDKLDLGVVLAFPLEPAGYQTETPDPRVLLTLNTRLLPWGDR
ncbi:MAG TPA: ShlB/FhaC/HecB family hemolysin secretion/activation protein [Croceibacterium sp.]